MQIEVRDGATSVGVANVDLARSGSYFETAAEVSFNIPEDKDYNLFVKTKKGLGRLFNSVTLSQTQTLDCTVASDVHCGELITQRDSKLLLLGDSDGFITSSGSYNKIDSADLQILASYFNQPGTGAAVVVDFNYDGNVDIGDLEILGKNYGQQGD